MEVNCLALLTYFHLPYWKNIMVHLPLPYSTLDVKERAKLQKFHWSSRLAPKKSCSFSGLGLCIFIFSKIQMGLMGPKLQIGPSASPTSIHFSSCNLHPSMLQIKQIIKTTENWHVFHYKYKYKPKKLHCAGSILIHTLIKATLVSRWVHYNHRIFINK